MTLEEIVEEARKLSVGEQKELIKLLVDMITEPREQPSEKHSLRELRGLGAHLYDGTDAQEYVNKMRDEWDAPKNSAT